MDISPRFKLTRTSTSKPVDPSALFKALKLRSKVIKRPWDNQAEAWRKYIESYETSENVAIEMPTGSGKTLVGLVIAEYRRLKFEERVLYLCPTRQLCKQVGLVAQECGINAEVILAPSYDGLSNFKLGQSIAITTYSALFNTKTRFESPDVIVLDDAHSAENYIADLWSLNLSRTEHHKLYTQIVNLLGSDLDAYSRGLLLEDDCSPKDKWYSHSIPITSIAENESALRDLIEQGLDQKDAQRFPWSMIKSRLHACQAYLTWHELLLRPYIPPTLTHHPFKSAKQRIYMSATLGHNGELERIVGVPKIERIAESEGESSGRRLILFPETKLSSSQTDALMKSAIDKAGRALVLTPSNREAQSLSKRLYDSGVKVLNANDIEDNLDAFCSRSNVALVVANRYDGIDLPDDSCRLLIVQGVPVGTNLQERFLFTHLGAGSVLADRMRTRLTQGFGRCCRNINDYAAILLLGEQLKDFCFDRLVKKGLNNDIQAELKFGLLQEDDLKTEKDYAGLIGLLLENGDQWEQAEQVIIQIRDEIAAENSQSKTTFPDTAAHEVNFVYYLWDKKFLQAAQSASKVTDTLHDVAGAHTYRAWWLYLTACAQWLEGNSTSEPAQLEKAKKSLYNAGELCTGITWFPELVKRLSPGEVLEFDAETMRVCSRIYRHLSQLGFTGKKFEQEIQEMIDRLAGTEATAFELGLLKLGELLGFNTTRPNQSASPDSIWVHEDQFAISIEAKSEETVRDPISYGTVRQVSFQPNWIRTNLSLPSSLVIHSLLVTPRLTINRDAQAEANSTSVMHLDDIRKLSQKLAAALRRVRVKGGTFVADTTIDEIQKHFASEELLPRQILLALTKSKLADLKIAKGT